MTTQVKETLLLDGQSLSMHTHPLEPWFDLAGVRSPFVCAFTWNRRGYHGVWEVVSDRLYLVGLSGTFSAAVEDLHFSEGSVATLFPGAPERVFAHWYSGRLQADGGEIIEPYSIRRPVVRERTVFIDVERGRVVGRTERINVPATADPAALAPASAPPRRP
jgi:hypothetical protein